MKTKWEEVLSQEIAIKYKAGIYSLCHLLYFALYLLSQQKNQIGLLQLAEIVLLAWLVNHLQVYLGDNFDEADQISGKWWFSAIICSILYLLAATLLNWFEGDKLATLGFGFFQLFCYLGVYINNKIKRQIDSRQLNQQLQDFKKRRGNHHD